MSGDQKGEAQVEMEMEGGGPGPGRGRGPAMAAAFTGTDPHSTPVAQRRLQQNRQQDKEEDAGPALGPAIGADPDVDSPLEEVGDAAPGTSTGPAPAEDPDANPLFKDAPSRNWKLHSKPDAMVKENQDVMDWIDQLLAEQAGIYCIEEEGQSHYLHQTTDGDGFFKLVLQPDVEALSAGQSVEGVKLVFSLKDLYLLGFLYKNTWYFYSDATLDGSGHNQPGNERYWDYLPFKGGYTKGMFANVKVGVYELNFSHHALSQYLSRLQKGQQKEIQRALYRVVVAIAEAKRFPLWLRVLQQSFADKISMVTGPTFGKLFQNWSNICKRVLEGPEDFEPDSDFANYGELVGTIAVLLSSAFADDDMSVESIDWQSKEVKRVFDPHYDFKEEEEVVVVDEEDKDYDKREEEEEEEEEEDSDQIEEDEEDAIVEEDEKSGGRGQNRCHWIIFFICIILVLGWMTVF